MRPDEQIALTNELSRAIIPRMKDGMGYILITSTSTLNFTTNNLIDQASLVPFLRNLADQIEATKASQ